MTLIKEHSYGITNFYGLYIDIDKEGSTMADGRKLSIPTKWMERYIREAIRRTPEVDMIPQYLIVVKMLFGRIPISAMFYNIDSDE